MVHDFLTVGETVTAEHETLVWHISEDCLMWRGVHEADVGKVVDSLAYGFFRKVRAENAEASTDLFFEGMTEDEVAWWKKHDSLLSFDGRGREFIVRKDDGQWHVLWVQVPYPRKRCFPPEQRKEILEALGGSGRVVEMYLKAGRV